MTATRTETDSFGPLEVPADKYWGAQTQRSILNFPIGWEAPAHRHRAGPRRRQAGLRGRRTRHVAPLPAEIADAIVAAASEVVAGRFDDNFPLVVLAGTGLRHPSRT